MNKLEKALGERDTYRHELETLKEEIRRQEERTLRLDEAALRKARQEQAMYGPNANAMLNALSKAITAYLLAAGFYEDTSFCDHYPPTHTRLVSPWKPL